MLCILSAVNAQSSVIDNAVKGNGINQHKYFGTGWIHGGVTHTFYNSTHSASNVAGAYVLFTFEGNKLEWYTEKKYTHGIVAVSIDDGAETFIDLFSGTEQHVLVYTTPVLTQGTHTFKIRATGTKNNAATNYYAIHDYFITYQASGSPPYPNESDTNVGIETLESTNMVPTGGFNAAFGYRALRYAHTSSGNTAIGANALGSVGKNNNHNTAVGFLALRNGVSGSYAEGSNTAVGALSMGDNSGTANTALGAESGPIVGTFVYNSTAIGYSTKTTAENQVRIGNPNVTSIGGSVSWSTLSDGRFKKELKDDVSGLEFINGLRPVSYVVDQSAVQRFMGISDTLATTRFAAKEKTSRHTGFVAQEVDKLVKKSGYVFNGVDAPKNDKDAYTIRYAEFVVPLVKAVQEMSVKLDEQQQQITELLAQIAEKEIDGLKSKTELMLFQNNPNPFSMDTEIKMTLPETTASARVIIYNLEGKQLKEINVKERGSASVKITANELNAGMYIYALIADGKVVATKRMILTQ